ncbi:MAG TPA: hypothetical protein VJ809_11165 [Pirellulales bacterium]|nr:hypothetical protein [Pirellulales bacterium]
MALVTEDYDPYVVLYEIPWKTYCEIDDALGEYHTRHARRVKSGRRRGRYGEIKKSIAFPFVEPEGINKVLAKKEVLDENSLVRIFLKRVRQRRNRSDR